MRQRSHPPIARRRRRPSVASRVARHPSLSLTFKPSLAAMSSCLPNITQPAALCALPPQSEELEERSRVQRQGRQEQREAVVQLLMRMKRRRMREVN